MVIPLWLLYYTNSKQTKLDRLAFPILCTPSDGWSFGRMIRRMDSPSVRNPFLISSRTHVHFRFFLSTIVLSIFYDRTCLSRPDILVLAAHLISVQQWRYHTHLFLLFCIVLDCYLILCSLCYAFMVWNRTSYITGSIYNWLNCTLLLISAFRSPEDSAFNQRNDTLFRQNKPSQSDDATLKKARKKKTSQVNNRNGLFLPLNTATKH